jgi:phospholipid-binding lipoprotein MlaA
MIRRLLRAGLLALLVAGAAGCATTGSGARSAKDPLEPMNRAVFAFNDAIDQAVLKPVARAYVDCVHEGIRGVIGNLFGNVADVWTGVNQLLQGKPMLALGDLSRFAINSTLGFFGVVDLASEIGLPKHKEDFGQTLGRWGVPAGPYLVLPILGPSSVRDTAGLPLDVGADPVRQIPNENQKWSAYSARVVDTRAGLLPAEKVLDGAALDKYSFIRDGYLQRRRSLVFDGNPPDDEELDDPREPPAKAGDAGDADRGAGTRPAPTPGSD